MGWDRQGRFDRPVVVEKGRLSDIPTACLHRRVVAGWNSQGTLRWTYVVQEGWFSSIPTASPLKRVGGVTVGLLTVGRFCFVW